MDFEYTYKGWNELKAYIDRTIEDELVRSKSNLTNRPKTRLAIEILNAPFNIDLDSIY